jgi:hypothetical protein
MPALPLPALPFARVAFARGPVPRTPHPRRPERFLARRPCALFCHFTGLEHSLVREVDMSTASQGGDVPWDKYAITQGRFRSSHIMPIMFQFCFTGGSGNWIFDKERGLVGGLAVHAEQLRRWLTDPKHAHDPLIIDGPAKSGKSTLSDTVLPYFASKFLPVCRGCVFHVCVLRTLPFTRVTCSGGHSLHIHELGVASTGFSLLSQDCYFLQRLCSCAER